MNEFEEQTVQENEERETYQKLEAKVVDVKAEKGYAASDGPLEAPQWEKGSW